MESSVAVVMRAMRFEDVHGHKGVHLMGRLTKLLYSHQVQLNGRNSRQDLWKVVGVDGLRLVESFLKSWRTSGKSA